MWWQTLLSVITFGIYAGRKARRKEAEDKADDWQGRAAELRRELKRRQNAK